MIFTFDYLFYLLECFCLDVNQNILFLSCVYIFIRAVNRFFFILFFAINHMIVMS